MSKRKNPVGRPAADPDEVLSGRVKVTAAEVLALIHWVNPTGRDLPAREAELRYAQKARLQSLLVRRFGPELEVVPDPELEGTVSIRHRGHGRDACHAVLDALDVDARAWVQLQLDLGPPSSAAAPPHAPAAPRPLLDEEEIPPSAEATPDSLLRRADEAVASYDYERARARLERAVAESGGAPEPSAALLSLLVDTLGDDAGALALQGSLARAALARADVRGLLALAEARAGDPEQAAVWIRGASDARAAEVLAALATRALSAGDAERAAGHLTELRRRDPAHPSIVSLTDEIGRLRAAARGPAEEELARIVAAGHDDEAEQKAALVLARWPESEAARRVIRAAEERRRKAEADRLAAEAEAALAAGDAAEARARLTHALASVRGPEREALERRARAIDAASRAARDTLAVDRVARLLGAADLREGLVAYLTLDEALRARVREVAKDHGAEAVAWLDLTGRGAPQARVEAVLALGRARSELAAGDAKAALATLEPQKAALERVPEAKQIAREARASLEALRMAHAQEARLAAKAALAAGAPAEALRRPRARRSSVARRSSSAASRART
jgi:hypothetical protein